MDFRKHIAIFSCLWSLGASALTTPSLPEIEHLQRTLFERAYRLYLTGLRTAHPEFGLGSTLYSPPPFEPTRTREDWLKEFPKWTLERRRLELGSDEQALSSDLPSLASLEKASRENFISYFRGVESANFATVVGTKFTTNAWALKLRFTQRLKLPCSWPNDHTLDVSAYVASRLPEEVQVFLKSTRAELVLDDSRCEDAYAVQRSQGFSRAFVYAADTGGIVSRALILASDRAPIKYRFLACQVRGLDDRKRAIETFGPLFIGKAVFISHAEPSPFIDFTDTAQSLKIDSKEDVVVIGYQNVLWWTLSRADSDKAWKRTCLTKSSVDIDELLNAATNRRIISVRNVYGDEILFVLRALWNRGARRFVYMGSAGALDPKFSLGDVLVPTKFRRERGPWFSFDNLAASAPLTLPAPLKVLKGTRHGFVSTLIEENKTRVRDLAKTGIQAVDIEALYFARFFVEKKSAQSILLMVSDKPLGGQTLDRERDLSRWPMRSASLVAAQLFSH